MASNSKALPVEGSTRTAYRDQLGSKVEPKKDIFLDDNVNVIYIYIYIYVYVNLAPNNHIYVYIYIYK